MGCFVEGFGTREDCKVIHAKKARPVLANLKCLVKTVCFEVMFTVL